MSHRNFTIGQLFLHKDRQSLLHLSGVVYQLTCTCGQKYISELNKISLLASMNIERVKTLKFANNCSIILTMKLILTHPKNFWTEVIMLLNYASQKLYVFPKQLQLNINNQSLPMYLFIA